MESEIELSQFAQATEIYAIASEYCSFTERASSYDINIVVNFYSNLSPLLYLKIMLLKRIDSSNPDLLEKYVTESAWEAIYNSIRNIFYPNGIFWITQSPAFQHTDIEQFDIAECISDVYQDLKDFVILFEKNQIYYKENAVNELKLVFPKILGLKLAKLQLILHEFIYNNQ